MNYQFSARIYARCDIFTKPPEEAIEFMLRQHFARLLFEFYVAGVYEKKETREGNTPRVKKSQPIIAGYLRLRNLSSMI